MARAGAEKAASFLAASEVRQALVAALAGGPRTPRQLADRVRRRLNHVSFYLRGLREAGLVEVLDPDARKGRLYALTPLAHEARRLLHESR